MGVYLEDVWVGLWKGMKVSYIRRHLLLGPFYFSMDTNLSLRASNHFPLKIINLLKGCIKYGWSFIRWTFCRINYVINHLFNKKMYGNNIVLPDTTTVVFIQKTRAACSVCSIKESKIYIFRYRSKTNNYSKFLWSLFS